VPELKEALRRVPPPVIVDVRGEGMRTADPRSVPGALPSTVSEVVRTLEPHPKATAIVVYCACPNDAGAAQAVRALMAAGYTKASALRGGLDAWFGDREPP
jgi:rhodanese-related sulfurtransferase